MNSYLFLIDGKYYTSRRNREPSDSIGVIPISIDSSDYEFLKHREIPHPEHEEETMLEIYVDETLKTQVLAQRDIDSIDKAWDTLREERNRLLTQCDWTQVADCPLGAAKKLEWVDYREELRDLPANTIDPKAPVWPIKPE